MKDHLANMAAIDKATDEERARRVMALEMRLAERRALARQKVSHGHLSYAWNIIVSLHGGIGGGGSVVLFKWIFLSEHAPLSKRL